MREREAGTQGENGGHPGQGRRVCGRRLALSRVEELLRDETVGRAKYRRARPDRASAQAGGWTAEGLALNSMGVDCMLSACPPSASSGFGATQLSEAARANLRRAIEYHESHLKVADEGGRFMASTNLGLCHGAMGDALASARHHQDALRIAISLQSFSGQSISVGNLGSLAMRQGDYATARPCMEQHLQLVQSLQDQGAEIHAYMQLGHLAVADSDFETALKSFQEAAHIAEQLQELGTLKRANCYVGIAKGSLTMSDMFSKLTDGIRAQEQANAPKVADSVKGGLAAMMT